ncbi:hypothetical protein [Piscibacillus halophilus]|uniref:Uncharacterized protein n=1 Tax=Piscibacillus halophilus TaxID=571933 RepID=A0A1H9CQA7_9BACI|nr:hypothetical protein [Piscibacillus halophilus]SEQ02798.1 hypothetical protein SAMN05216362_105121 [Piscibacillus halophilus]
MRKSQTEIKRGQAISFRIPSDTPDHLLKELQHLKETERRNFSSKIAEFVLEGVNQNHSKERETITIPLPNKLSKAQRNWIKHEHSEALLGSIIYHLLNDPVRATSLLASLNSRSTDIDEALYLQEVDEGDIHEGETEVAADVETNTSSDADLEEFNWEDMMKQRHAEEEKTDQEEPEETDLDELLGDFLNKMNK